MGQYVRDLGGPWQLCGLEMEAAPWDAGSGPPLRLFSSEGPHPPTAGWRTPGRLCLQQPGGLLCILQDPSQKAPPLKGVLWDLQHTPPSHQRPLHRAGLADQRRVLPGLCPASTSSHRTTPPPQGSGLSALVTLLGVLGLEKGPWEDGGLKGWLGRQPGGRGGAEERKAAGGKEEVERPEEEGGGLQERK